MVHHQSDKGKRPLENDNDEEATRLAKIQRRFNGYEALQCGIFNKTADSPMIPLNPSNDNRNQSNGHDDLDRGLGLPDQQDATSLVEAIGWESTITCLIQCSRFDYASIVSVNRRFRELIRSGEIYELRWKYGVTEHWVYFSCNSEKWEAFDPVNRKWMNLPPITVANPCFHFGDKETLAVGTELFVMGREILGNVIYKYNLLTNSWSQGAQMNSPRCLFGSASNRPKGGPKGGPKAYVAGGCDPNGKILDLVEMYDSESGTWETLPSMLKPRKMCSGIFMDEKFYVIGGTGSDKKPLTCGEVYDFNSKEWKEIPNMSPVRVDGASSPPLVAVADNELYAADCANMVVKKYDKVRNTWESIGRLPERANSMEGWGIAFRGCGNRVVVIGGPRSSGPGFVEVNSWVPNEGPLRWTLLGLKRSNNFVYNCTVMGC